MEVKELSAHSSDRRERRGISIGFTNFLLIVIALGISCWLILSTVESTVGYQEMKHATEAYIQAQKDVTQLQNASDELTRQVRVFAVTGNREAMDAFMYEVEVARNREKAVEDIESLQPSGESRAFVEQALKYSMELVQIEYRAMRLTALGLGMDETQLPEQVRNARLSDDEFAMDAEAKRKLARNLVFDEDYQAYKDSIRQSVAQCSEALIEGTKIRQTTSSSRLLSILRRQQVLIIGLLVTIAALVGLHLALVMGPMHRMVRHVKAQERVPLHGSREMKYLASAFNEMLDKSQRDKALLSYEASHDALTGVYNRKSYESVMETHHNQELALILVDIDEFKRYNDQFGHEMGDKVLKRVAGVLTSSFRSDDYVCRIGGDEFCVIMLNMRDNLEFVVRHKITSVMENLKPEKDGVPSVTLSVGVAFTEDVSDNSRLFQAADQALYSVKGHGRNGYRVYAGKDQA